MPGVGGWGPEVDDGTSAHSAGTAAIRTDAIAALGVDFAFRLGPDGCVEAVEGEVERLVGTGAEAVVGNGFERYVVDEYVDAAFEAFSEVTAGETVVGLALRLTGDDHPWVEVNAEPVVRDGSVVAVRGAAREATERRRAIERHSEAMAGAMDGMALLDDDGRYLFVNEAHADLYGYARSDLVGSHWSTLYDEAEQRRLEREALPAVEAEGCWRGTAVGRRADGSTFQQELSLSGLAEGGLVCVVRDVTDRHRREQIISVLDRVLRHNLRNEMNVIMGEAQQIARRVEGEEAATARIVDRAENLLDISETARTIRKVVSDDHDGSATDLGALVRDCSARVAPDEDTVVTDLPDDPTPVACAGARAAVRALVENAVTYGAPPDADAPAVRVDLFRVDDGDGASTAVLRVADSGPGLPRMERETLEEGSETPLRHGQGLGLWLVNWVVTEAGGELSVGDREGGGTVVEMRVPVVDGVTDADSAAGADWPGP